MNDATLTRGEDTGSIRVLVADDQRAIREAICDLVDTEDDMEIAGVAPGADEAIALAQKLQPDVALLDVKMLGGGGRAVEEIAVVSPETKSLALSAYEDWSSVLEMLRSGAVGYLVKGAPPTEIIEAIRRAARRQASLSAETTARMIEALFQDIDERLQREDIHDDSIQAMTAAGIRLQLLRRELHEPQQVGLLDALERTIELSISRLRHLLFELRPPVLDREGLAAALGMYLDELRLQTAATYRFNDELRLQADEAARITLYRVAQEALTNVRKHAQANEVEVLIAYRGGGFVVRVTDDGVGFSPESAFSIPGHLGLVAMRERVELGGGTITIDSAPQTGTVIECWLPQVARPGDPVTDGGEKVQPVG